MIRRGYDMTALDKTIRLLASGQPLPAHYKDHQLKGDFKENRECHIGGAGDWLLTYRKHNGRLVLLLIDTGTHSDLF
jgi:mRNA interferase YafQ